MTELRRRMVEDLQLRGLAPKTHQCDVDAVKQLAQYYRRSPDHIHEEQIRQYFLYLLNEKQVAETTFPIHLYGIRFFYEHTLKRPWPVFELVRPRKTQKLPIVLSPQEVRYLLALVERPKARMCLQMIYTCGLRLREGTPLQAADIDPHRLLVRVRQGKGGKDRYVPLAERTLQLLRAYWRHGRPRPWLFPARHRPAPLSPTSLQKTFKAVVRQSGLSKDASIHTLRHSYATHLLGRGVSLRVIQDLLGHKSPSTTARYTHLTPPTLDVVHATMNALMADHCGQEHYVYHSCRNRSCPKCHHHETEAWLAERRQELLPIPYFHIVFTVPHELGEIIRHHQQDLYGILLRAAAQALINLAADPHYVGGLIGVLCVLHTWTRTRAYHPHVHCLVPAGEVSADRTEWRPARTSYLVPVHALSKLFRGLFRDLVRQERPDLTIPKVVWSKGWVVYCKLAVQGTEQVLQYLGWYVHRIALTNSRILSIEDGHIRFRYQDAEDQRWKTMTLPALEFIRRFLQHVLPQGFHKVRYYGLWSPRHRSLRQQLQLWLAGYAPIRARRSMSSP